MIRKMLSFVLALALCLGVWPVQAFAAEGEPREFQDSAVPFDDAQVVDSGMPGLRKAAARVSASDVNTQHANFLFANGIPIVIREVSGTTNIYSEDGTLLCENVRDWSVYGGWYDGNNEHTADTSVVMESGTVKALFGGSLLGTLNGDTNVVVRGGTITDALYGGGNQSTINGNTNVVLKGGNCNFVYGGGWNSMVEQATIELGSDWINYGCVYAGGGEDTPGAYLTKSAKIIINNYATGLSRDTGIDIDVGNAKDATVVARRSEGGPLGQANSRDYNLTPVGNWNVVAEYGKVIFMAKGSTVTDLTLDSLDVAADAQVGFQDWDSIDIKEISGGGGQFLFPAHFGGSGLIKPAPITVERFSITSPLILKAEGTGWSNSALQDTVFFKGPGVDNLTSLAPCFFSEGYIVDRRAIDGESGQGIYLLPKSVDKPTYISKLEFNDGTAPYNGKISLTVGVAQHLATIDSLEVIPGARIQIRGNNADNVLFADVRVSETEKKATITDVNGNTWDVELGEGDYITFEVPVNAALLDTSEEGLMMIATAPGQYSNSVQLVGPDGGHKIEITPTPITLTETIPAPAFQDPMESALEEGDFYTAGVRWHSAGSGVSGAFQLDRDYQADIVLTPKAGHWLSEKSIGSTVNYNGEDIPCVFNTDGTVTLPNLKTARFEGRTVTLTASPAEGGTVTGGGRYPAGTQVTVKATPAENWQFAGWEENGSIVSTLAEYTFAASANRTLTARFEKIQYTVTLTASPAEGGTVTGGGRYPAGAQVTVTAALNPGWQFKGWQENGAIVSPNLTYSFPANASRSLTALFEREEITDEDTEVKSEALTEAPGDLKNHPVFNTPEKITAELRRVVETHISGVGDNLAVYDVKLVYRETGLPVEPENFPPEGIDAVLPYPEGTNGDDYTFTIQHMISYGPDAGTVEDMRYTALPNGLGCRFNSLSPVAIGWQKKDAVKPAPAPAGGSSGSEKSNDEYDFWQEVRRKIEKAAPGDTVRVNARGYDKLPWSVMDALKNSSGVTLVIGWSGGDEIVIPSAGALEEALRIYYPLAYLAGYDFGIPSAPLNPETGGVWAVEAPVTAEAAPAPSGAPEVTDPRRGLADTPEQAARGVERAIPGTYEPAAPEGKAAPRGDGGNALGAALLLLAASACGVLAWKKRRGPDSLT